MKTVAQLIDLLTQEQIAQLENNGHLNLQDVADATQNYLIELADVEVVSQDMPGWIVSNEGNLTVALEVELNEQLRQEGLVREIINRVQNLRKDKGLEITDHIQLIITPDERLQKAVRNFGEYLKEQVLAESVEFMENEGEPVEIDSLKLCR